MKEKLKTTIYGLINIEAIGCANISTDGSDLVILGVDGKALIQLSDNDKTRLFVALKRLLLIIDAYTNNKLKKTCKFIVVSVTNKIWDFKLLNEVDIINSDIAY